MKSYLSGNPEIRLALNDDLSIGRGRSSIYGISGQHRNLFKYSLALSLFILSGCLSYKWIKCMLDSV